MTTGLDQDFLIDVSEEDDNLLPNRDKGLQIEDHGSINSGSCSSTDVKDHNVKDVCSTEGDLSVSQSAYLAEQEQTLPAPPICDVLLVAKKKKNPGFNVRKSMAWNNAFLTDEGVLDSEELSLVNKTFPKLSNLPKQNNSRKPSPTSKLMKPPLLPSRLGPPKVVLNSKSKEHLCHSDLNCCQGNTGKLVESNSINLTGLSKDKLNPGDLIIAAQKKLGRTGRSEEKPSSKETFVDTSQSAFNRSTGKHFVSNSTPMGSITNLETVRLSSTKLSMERSASAPKLEAQTRTSLLKLPSEHSSSKAHHSLTKSSLSDASGAVMSRDKPSRLQMPSPKLGFFDTSKTKNQVLPERRSGHSFVRQGPGVSSTAHLEVKERGSNDAMGCSNQRAMSGRPFRELQETHKDQNRVTQTLMRIPMAPLVPGRRAQFASLQLDRPKESPRLASQLPNTANCTKWRLHTKTIDNGVINNNTVKKRLPANSKTSEQENFSPNCDEGTDIRKKCSLALDLAMRNC